MKKYLTIIAFSFMAMLCQAQNYDRIWLLASSYDGWHDDECIKLDFTKKDPGWSFRKTPIYFRDNGITISDSIGNLLFYTNGCDYLDKENTLLLKYDSLDLDYALKYCFEGNPTTQNIILLPFPNQQLFYSIYKNLVLVKPKGELVSTKLMSGKININNNEEITLSGFNLFLIKDTLTTGFLTATKHINLNDWWLICWRNNTNQYVSILVKPDTIIKSGYQSIGDTINRNGDGIGQAVFSPDGTKYAFTNVKQGAFLFDFDRATGELSNYKRIQLPISDSTTTFGCAFSSNGRFLYVCGQIWLYQIDTWSQMPDTTLEVVAEYSGILDQCGPLPATYFKAQLAPDCRIYISAPNGVSCLTVINHPNIKGKDCEVINGGLAFPENVYNVFTIPNYPNYRLGTGEVCDSSLALPVATKEPQYHFTKENILVFPNPATELLYLVFPKELKLPDAINIISITGQAISKIDVKNNLQDNKISIDINRLDKGLYFLYWIDPKTGKSFAVKFVKE